MHLTEKEILDSHESYYTKIPNDLLEALTLAELTSMQRRLCLFIIRRTFGWHRSEAEISTEDFKMACCSGRGRSYVCEQLAKLVELGIVTRKKRCGKPAVYRLVTDLSQWSPECFNQANLQVNQESYVYSAYKPITDNCNEESHSSETSQPHSSYESHSSETSQSHSNATCRSHSSATTPTLPASMVMGSEGCRKEIERNKKETSKEMDSPALVYK